MGFCLISPFISVAYTDGRGLLLDVPLKGPLRDGVAVLYCPGNSSSSRGDFRRLLDGGLSWSSLNVVCLLVRPTGLHGRPGPETDWAFFGSLEEAVKFVGWSSDFPEALVLREEALWLRRELAL